MQTIRNIFFFMNEHVKKLRKKWGTLLLLFLFPLILISMVLLIVAGLLIPDEKEPIRIAVVDEDQTEESRLITKLLVETANGEGFIQMIGVSKDDAEQYMKKGELSTYFSLPPKFTEMLYEGDSVVLPIVGNPSRPVDSYLTKELIDSLARYIAGAQANILTINDYAKETPMTKEERMEMMFAQFMDFTLFTLGKDKLIDEEILANAATSSPVNYYIVSAWFIALTIWIGVIYNLLGIEEQPSMAMRLKLLGVTSYQRMFARLVVAVSGVVGLAMLLFIGFIGYADMDFYIIDMLRVLLFTSLYVLTTASLFALIDVWFPSRKAALFLQCAAALLIVFSSGAIVPTLYFPQTMQPLLPYLFSYSDLKWVMDIVLEGRNYADYSTAVIHSLFLIFMLFLSLIWRERRRVG
ncbi:ABC-2 type transport system permease protein [Sporosarcina luteola]|nr:ABC-2 type transport system permease protein [Sporosarcina luteola]